MSKESYARGFIKAASKAGVDPAALAKYAGELEEIARTRELDDEEKERLIKELPESRRKEIRKFLLEELYGGKDKRYIVKAKGHNIPSGEYTYIPATDKLYESSRQAAENQSGRDLRHAWGRAALMGMLFGLN